ncbi:unnamed protein product [Aphanomyces euteiches]
MKRVVIFATASSLLVDYDVFCKVESRLQDVKIAQEVNSHAVLSPFNVFKLLKNDEFKQMVNKEFATMASKPTTAQQVQVEEPLVSINVSIDCNSAVKDQDHCGSWYRRVCLATAGEHLDLSEQQTLNEDAYSYASDKLGVPGACQTNCTKKQLTLGLSKWTSIEANLNVLHVQPITVTVQGGNPVWRNYRSKIVTQWPGVRSDHAAVDVGYGTNGTLSFFKIQNSSGSRCGQSGYMHKRGVGSTSTNHHLETNNEANDDEKVNATTKNNVKTKDNIN